MAKVLRSAGHYLIPVKENLVDKIWTDRPERPCRPLLTLGLNYTGQNHAPQPLSPSRHHIFPISIQNELELMERVFPTLTLKAFDLTQSRSVVV